jgi:hypothetical protein
MKFKIISTQKTFTVKTVPYIVKSIKTFHFWNQYDNTTRLVKAANYFVCCKVTCDGFHQEEKIMMFNPNYCFLPGHTQIGVFFKVIRKANKYDIEFGRGDKILILD